jgi:hypothetical protein
LFIDDFGVLSIPASCDVKEAGSVEDAFRQRQPRLAVSVQSDEARRKITSKVINSYRPKIETGSAAIR